MIRGTFRNDIGANKIKIGETELAVSISFDKNTVVAKRTTKAATTYTVNGVEYGKLAGNIPEAVAKMGYSSIHIGNVELDPIFGGQFDNQFLLCSSPADLNTVLGAFSSTEKLDQGKKRIGTKIKELDVEAKVTAKMITDAEAKAHKLSMFLEQAKPVSKTLKKLDSRNNELLDTVDCVDTFLITSDKLDKLVETKSEIDVLDFDLTPVANNSKVSSLLSTYRYSRYAYSLSSKSLETFKELVELVNKQSRLSSIVYLLDVYNKKSVTLDTKALDTDSLNKDKKKLLDLDTACLLLPNYIGYIRLLKLLKNDLDTVSSDLESTSGDLKDLRKQEQIEQASKVECPKCGYMFKVEV
jgi:hypothetical protein